MASLTAEQPQILPHGRLFRRLQLDGRRRGAWTLAFSPLRRSRRSSTAPLALPTGASVGIANASAADVWEIVGKTANGKKRTPQNLRLRSRYRGLFASLRLGRSRHLICSVRRAARPGQCVRLTDASPIYNVSLEKSPYTIPPSEGPSPEQTPRRNTTRDVSRFRMWSNHPSWVLWQHGTPTSEACGGEAPDVAPPVCKPPRHAAPSTTFPSSHAHKPCLLVTGPNKNTESPSALFHRIPMCDRSPFPHNDLLHALFARPLEQPWNSGVDALRTGSNRWRQPSTYDVRLRHGDKLCVERDNPLSRQRPAFTTTVVCTVCARSTPIPFQATRSMESHNIAHSRGHSLHDEHPWVKTVKATLS